MSPIFLQWPTICTFQPLNVFQMSCAMQNYFEKNLYATTTTTTTVTGRYFERVISFTLCLAVRVAELMHAHPLAHVSNHFEPYSCVATLFSHDHREPARTRRKDPGEHQHSLPGQSEKSVRRPTVSCDCEASWLVVLWQPKC